MQKAGDKVRVNVQLIDARADTHLWAKSYDRDFKDVLAVESEIAAQIADALKAIFRRANRMSGRGADREYGSL